MAKDNNDLNGDVVHIIRNIEKEMTGSQSTFIDDGVLLMGVLAQRAVLAGLHSDIKCEITRANLEKAASPNKTLHEKELGFAIKRQTP